MKLYTDARFLIPFSNEEKKYEISWDGIMVLFKKIGMFENLIIIWNEYPEN